VVESIENFLAEENSLQSSSGILRAIILGSPDAIFVKDLQGRYVLINDAGARVVGKTVEEMLGRKDVDVLPPDLANAAMKDDQAVMNDGVVRTFENVVTSTETTRRFHVLKSPYSNDAGELIGVITEVDFLRITARLMERLA